MKKLFGVLRIAFVLTVMMMSCNEAPLASDATTTSITEADSSKTEHKNCKIDCAKPCCAVKEVKKCCKSNSAKTCAADSATYAAMKAKCQTECGTDSTICAAHKSESDSTTVNACKVDCTKPCCSADEKKTCKANCEKECCATK
jgi:hypothetical protein